MQVRGVAFTGRPNCHSPCVKSQPASRNSGSHGLMLFETNWGEEVKQQNAPSLPIYLLENLASGKNFDAIKIKTLLIIKDLSK